MLRKAAVPKRICDRRRAQNANLVEIVTNLSLDFSYRAFP